MMNTDPNRRDVHGALPERVTAASGGESNPVDTNATAQGQAENRRTDLVVTAK